MCVQGGRTNFRCLTNQNRENRANVNKNLQLFRNERSPCTRWTHVAPAWTQLKRLHWKADGGKQLAPSAGSNHVPFRTQNQRHGGWMRRFNGRRLASPKHGTVQKEQAQN